MEYRSRRLFDGKAIRESGLKGVHQKRATGWRTLPPTPAGSGKSARPVPGRTRDTDHRQRSCRAASAGAVKRGARRHPLSEKKKDATASFNRVQFLFIIRKQVLNVVSCFQEILIDWSRYFLRSRINRRQDRFCIITSRLQKCLQQTNDFTIFLLW